MFFCPSVINKGVGFYLPSLGEGLGVGIVSFCPSVINKGGGCQSPSLGEGRGVLVTPRRGIDMSAPGSARGIGCSMDTPPKGAKE